MSKKYDLGWFQISSILGEFQCAQLCFLHVIARLLPDLLNYRPWMSTTSVLIGCTYSHLLVLTLCHYSIISS